MDRSPAYQDYCSGGLIRIFAIQGWTDDLFTAHEVIRLRNVLDAQCGSEYPLKAYFGNSGHPRALADDPDEQAFILGRVKEWLRFYLLDQGPQPTFDVVSGVTKAHGEELDPSAVFSVAEFEEMMRGEIRGELKGTIQITHAAGTTPDLHADPVVGEIPVVGGPLFTLGQLTADLVETTGPLTGDAAVYTVDASEIVPPGAPYSTICGTGSVDITGSVAGTDVQYAVRIWDLGPDRGRYLVDRGMYRYLGTPGSLEVTVPLHGNAWRLRPDHQMVIEITNSASSEQPRVGNVISGATLNQPTCEAGTARFEVQGQLQFPSEGWLEHCLRRPSLTRLLRCSDKLAS